MTPAQLRKALSLAAVLAIGTASVAETTETVEELELIRAAFDSPALSAAIEATRAEVAASGTPTPLFENPTIGARREVGPGDSSESIQAVGASFTIDLGLSSLPEREAAELRRAAGEAWLRARAVEELCAVRGHILSLWQEIEQVDRAWIAHRRLLGLETAMEALTESGETSSYDRDLLDLSLRNQRVGIEGHEAELIALQIQSQSLWGERPVDAVALTEFGVEQFDEESAFERALERDPMLSALRQQRSSAELSLAAARRAAAPDLNLSGDALFDSNPNSTGGTPGYEVGISIEIPISDRNQVAVAEARATAASLDEAIALREQELYSSINVATALSSMLGPTQIPLSFSGEETWLRAKERYDLGEATIEELLHVAGTIEEAELAAIETHARRYRARLQLSCAVGAFMEPQIETLLEEIVR